ncbi:DNA translocase FtsK [bacterium]|nr:DNA translocase FtsK [bacterium]
MPDARRSHGDEDTDDGQRRPSGFQRFATGLGAFSLGVFICGACGSYSPSDPSLNTASAVPAMNLFGRTGAIGADLFTQGFGWTAWLMGFALMVAGLRRALGIGPRDAARWGFGAVALVLAACCLAEWPIPQTWPLATGLGGVLGDVLLSLASTPFAALGAPSPEAWAAMLAGVGAVAFAGMSLGLGAHDGAALIRTLHRGANAPAEAMLERVRTRGLPFSPARIVSAVSGLFDRRRRTPMRTPIAYTDDEAFDDGERGFFTAVANAEIGRPGPKDGLRPAINHTPDEDDADDEIAPAVAPRQPIVPARAAPPQVRASIATPTHITPPTTNEIIPPIELLDTPPQRRSEIDEQRLLEMADRLQVVFNDFGVKGKIVEVRPGPVVTLFELEPAPGVKSSRVVALAEDIARSMSATSARVAVIPGRNAIGIELPNPTRETVYLRDLLSSQEFRRSRAALPLTLGETIEGQPTVTDLAKMPHLLIAGTTGSGKSVGINAMILSLMFKLPPEKCRFIMIDPKMLELSIYEGIPHLLSPVVTEPEKAVLALNWVVREMDSRYELMSKLQVRNIAGYNQKASEYAARGEHFSRPVQTGWNKQTGEAIFETEQVSPDQMPHIVVVIDEMADLMLVAGKDVESLVQRIAQKARAAGIHLIMATQRPSVDVITGTIKANFPTRISYQVASRIDSRTIINEMGAEQLLGMGDLLWLASGGRLNRVHGPFVSEDEVERVVEWLKDQAAPQYVSGVTEAPEEDESVADAAFGTSSGDPDEDLYRDAVAAVMRDKRPTISYVQRVLRIGYNRAALLIERMEEEGIISAANHAGKREILNRVGRDDEAA